MALAALMFASSAAAVHAQGLIESGFLSDYSQLQKVTDGTADYRYIAPGAEDKLVNYFAVMVDEPEFFIAADSPYRGVKARQLNELAHALRDGFAEGIHKEFFIVNRAAEGVLYVRAALSNLRLKRTRMKGKDFIPVMLVTTPVRRAATTDIAKNADLQSYVIEMEVFDSMTGERLFAAIDSRSRAAGDTLTWEEVDRLARDYGEVMLCRMKNSKFSEVARARCLDLIRH